MRCIKEKLYDTGHKTDTVLNRVLDKKQLTKCKCTNSYQDRQNVHMYIQMPP